MHNTSSKQDNPFSEEQQERNISISPFAVRAALEAIYGSFGAVINQEAPAIALYEFLSMQEVHCETKAPKIMFTVFNAGKALGSKVKFSKFYLMMDF